MTQCKNIQKYTHLLFSPTALRMDCRSDHTAQLNHQLHRTGSIVFFVNLIFAVWTCVNTSISKSWSCLLRLCNLGETLPLSSGNKITLKFSANGTATAKGFHFVYQGKTAFSDTFPEYWCKGGNWFGALECVRLLSKRDTFSACTHHIKDCSAECHWLWPGIAEQSRMMWSQTAYPGTADESD